jgi:polyhydroxybutyrate depolymerase
MKTQYLLIIIFSFIANFNFAQTTTHTITIGSDIRTYHVYRPTGFNQQTESLPVIFVLHGLGGNASQMMLVGFNQIADTARAIVVYPEGKVNSYNQQAWANGTALQSNANDVQFINVLIDTLFYRYNINLSRVYVAGLSMGGIMAHRLGCRLSNRIAAIASMTGTISTDDLTNCTPAFPIPVIHWHGTADATVPYNSGQLPTLELVPSTMHYWLTKNNCTPIDSVITPIPDIAADGYTIDKIVYSNCPGTVKVELWRINNGPHTWYYQPANDADGAKEFWKFFRQFQHSSPAPASIRENLNSNQVSIFPNPSNNGLINIEGVSNSANIEVYNLEGKLLLQSNIHSSDKIFLEKKGIYLMKVIQSNDISIHKVIVQ